MTPQTHTTSGGLPEPLSLSWLDRPLALAEHVQFTAVDGEVILIDLAREQFYGLNAVGAALWQDLAQGLAPRAVLEQLLAEFDVSPELLEADAARTVELFLQNGWLREELDQREPETE